MGYRSYGSIHISDAGLEILPNNLREDLNKNWTKDTENDWSFEYLKWYDSYDDVKYWISFMTKMRDRDILYDFIRIGEDPDDVEIATGERYYCERSVGYY